MQPTLDPVRHAVANEIGDGFPDRYWVIINFPLSDGGIKVAHLWTPGGAELGNKIDEEALKRGLDAADWLALPDRHTTRHQRGRIAYNAYDLRGLATTIRSGQRAPAEWRNKVRGLLTATTDRPPCPVHGGLPPWLGVGPALVHQEQQ